MSIVDSDKGTLNKTIWDNNQLKPIIKNLILNPIYNKLKELKLPISTIQGIYFVGSNATTRFRENSDVDINVVIDVENASDLLELITELNSLSGKIIPKTKHEINYYITTPDYQMNMPNIYDVVNNQWIRNEQLKDIDVELYKNYAKPKLNDINYLIFELESNIIDYKDLVYLADDKLLNKKVQGKIREIEQDMYKIKSEYDDIKLKRKTDFKDESYNNIVYKLLEKYNLLHKLINIKRLLEDGFQVSDIHNYTERIFKTTKGIRYYKNLIEKLKERLK